MSVSKFEGTTGYNLTRKERPAGTDLNTGAIPEFINVTSLQEVYRALADANMRNNCLSPSNDLKAAICLIQFKTAQNTISFVNMPQSADINYRTFSEILSPKQDYLPFNKSILTRILYSQVKKRNILVVSHFTKSSIGHFLKVPQE